MVQTMLVYAGLVAAPSAAFALARWWAERYSSGGRHRGPSVPGPTAEQRLGLLVARLARLDGDLDRLGSAGATGGGSRRRALALAYDDTLRDCSLALGLPDPGPAPLGGVVRLQVEAQLAGRGVQW